MWRYDWLLVIKVLKYVGGRRWELVILSILVRYFLLGFKIVVMIWFFLENKWIIENLMV